ncbi:helicase-related protein [Salinicoccus roseus]|uniref:helicase-related protein n=1 Tax=Salinicoccus roseus TaxID=45670 RepID=UPI00230150BE|nr:helicase-related protein [Salinicoccus roseus]
MVEFEKQAEIRNEIINYTKRLLLGPGSEKGAHLIDEEIITESPYQRYLTGILYTTDKNEDSRQDDEYIDTLIDNEFKPKSMGLTFHIKNKVKNINFSFATSFYEEISDLEKIIVREEDITYFEEGMKKFSDTGAILSFEKGEYSLKLREDVTKEKLAESYSEWSKSSDWDMKEDVIFLSYVKKLNNFLMNGGYKREARKIEFCHKLPDAEDESICKNYLEISLNEEQSIVVTFLVRKLKLAGLDAKSVTVVVQNNGSKELFQSQISIESNEPLIASEEVKLQSPDLKDSEEKQNLLLYKNKKTYGVGHGVSVQWEEIPHHPPQKLFTEYIPEYEIKPISFEIAPLKELDVLNALNYIYPDRDKIVSNLKSFTKEYKKWIEKEIDKVGSLDEALQETAWENIEKCHFSLKRMNKSIKLINEDDVALKIFNLANEAMILQRMNNACEKQYAFKQKKYPDSILEWRPFQLAFILNSFESVINEKSDYRDLLDLMWVPTGGGKTEAYLFIIATTIFNRRLRFPAEEDGTTVIMRYTLRLLTTQQFERAASLISACEFLRAHNSSELGQTKISIGLWVGQNTTPNKNDDANKNIKNMKSQSFDSPQSKSVFQLLECPWCKADDSLFSKSSTGRLKLGIKEASPFNDYHNFRCLNKDCHFNTSLPIHVVDENIYRHRPTLLFGTVDKFARVPLNADTSKLFATDNEDVKPPELIIQDELHLISGPLGSIVGLYETAFDFILSKNGIKPKYIASTATIRNAQEQVKSLFNRDYQQFPPSGLDSDDNFFVKVDETSPGRKYIGLIGNGKSQLTSEVRIVSSLLQSVFNMNLTDEERELFWTIAGYFNSIRELGRMNTLLKDDIEDYLLILRQRNFHKKRYINNSEELTSRKSSSSIRQTLDKLEIKYPSNSAIDIVNATNMLSVGIDISRLNCMFVVGQPKLTSEYIQATSRVGRKDLGMVWTLYNSMRSRDKSHYENFHSYHQSLYRYVEPSSVTPFSLPALDKALGAVIVAMMRNIDSNMESPSTVNEEDLDMIEEFLLERVNSIDSAHGLYIEGAENKITQLIEGWKDIIQSGKDLRYYVHSKQMSSSNSDTDYLLKDYGIPGYDTAEYAMNSMRDVDENAYLTIEERVQYE